jgi:hypothetical protein
MWKIGNVEELEKVYSHVLGACEDSYGPVVASLAPNSSISKSIGYGQLDFTS